MIYSCYKIDYKCFIVFYFIQRCEIVITLSYKINFNYPLLFQLQLTSYS